MNSRRNNDGLFSERKVKANAMKNKEIFTRDNNNNYRRQITLWSDFIYNLESIITLFGY